MAQKKILILYTSIGWGHKSIAENFAFHFQEAGFEVAMLDVLKSSTGPLVKLSEKLHGFINRHLPFVWEWMYTSRIVTWIMLGVRGVIARNNSGAIMTKVEEFNPDVILSTQAAASAGAAYLKQSGGFHGKLVIAFSDYHLHRLWLYDEADLYLAVTEEQKSEMERLGIASNRIVVCGITLKPKHEIDLESVRHRLGLKEGRVVLVLSGSLGIGFPEQELLRFIKLMAQQSPDTRLIIVCGKNVSLKARLDREEQKNILALGMDNNMDELYAVADVVVTKPGGMSLAEIWQRGLVPIVTHWLPGQETLNVKFLKKHHLVQMATQPLRGNQLADEVQQALENEPAKLPALGRELTQLDHEGEIAVKAVKSMFHSV